IRAKSAARMDGAISGRRGGSVNSGFIAKSTGGESRPVSDSARPISRPAAVPCGMSTAIQTEVDRVRAQLREVGQEHLLNFFDALDDVDRQDLLHQIAAINLKRIPALVERYVRSRPAFAIPADV